MKIALIIFGILTIISILGGDTFGTVLFGIFTLMFLIDIYSDYKKMNTQSKNNSTSSGSNYGQLFSKDPYKLVATFKNGVVYLAQYNTIIGYYDANGNVFNQKREVIGEVEDRQIILDRTSVFKDFQNSSIFDGDIDLKQKVHNKNYQPPLKLYVATHEYSYIEIADRLDGADYYIVNCKTDSEKMNRYGSCAAYITLIEDGIIHDDFHEFYTFSNVQADFYLRTKNQNIKNWSPYFQNKYKGIVTE